MATAVKKPARLPIDKVFTFGQVVVQPLGSGKFRLSHRDDEGSDESRPSFTTAQDALEIAREDDDGNYRPLKTAPNLRHGWQLKISGEDELQLALDFFYPGRLAVLLARVENRLQSTPFRDTLGRQTGMYRMAANISDEQLDCLIADFCRSDCGCLRTILWSRDAGGSIASTKLPPEKFDPDYDQALTGGAPPIGDVTVPLVCQEGCNLLVAECRKVVRGERTAH